MPWLSYTKITSDSHTLIIFRHCFWSSLPPQITKMFLYINNIWLIYSYFLCRCIRVSLGKRINLWLAPILSVSVKIFRFSIKILSGFFQTWRAELSSPIEVEQSSISPSCSFWVMVNSCLKLQTNYFFLLLDLSVQSAFGWQYTDRKTQCPKVFIC